jgi:hypothetical protein
VFCPGKNLLPLPFPVMTGAENILMGMHNEA